MTTWERKKVDKSIERRIITGMIVSDQVLRNLSLTYKPRYMSVPYAMTVASWCLEYFAQYAMAPQAHIQDLFLEKRRGGLIDPEQSELISNFLANLSEEYEREGFNSDYLIDQAQAYFDERSVTLLHEDLGERIAQGNILAAKESIADYIAPEGSIDPGTRFFNDMDSMREAFEEQDELYQLPGDLGSLLGPFERDTTWGIVGAYKGGKTWFCQYLALQALYSRLNVAWFSLEMPKKPTYRRMTQGICGLPDKSNKGVLLPVWDCELNQENVCLKAERVYPRITLKDEKGKIPNFFQSPKEYRPCTFCKGRKGYQPAVWAETNPHQEVLTWRTGWKRAQAMSKQLMGAQLRFQFWPKYSAGIPEIKSTLLFWEHVKGFVADIIIVDYVDILRREKGKDDRHAINYNRELLTALAQEKHTCLFTPVQAGSKAAIERKKKLRSDVAEDSRILGHVDGMIIIDQTDEERERMMSRVSVSISRHDKSVLHNEVVILQQLDLGQPVLDSCFLR